MLFDFTEKLTFKQKDKSNVSRVDIVNFSAKYSLSIVIFVLSVVNIDQFFRNVVTVESNNNESIVLFYPSNGIYLALTLTFSAIYLPLIFFSGALIAHQTGIWNVEEAIMWGCVRYLIFCVVYYIIRIKLYFSYRELNRGNTLKLVFASLLVMLLNGTIIPLVLASIGFIEFEILHLVIFDFFIGDGMGILFATPIFLFVVFPGIIQVYSAYQSNRLIHLIKQFSNYLNTNVKSRESIKNLIFIVLSISLMVINSFYVTFYVLFFIMATSIIFVALNYSFHFTITFQSIMQFLLIYLMNINDIHVDSEAIKTNFALLIIITIFIVSFSEEQKEVNQSLQTYQDELVFNEKLELLEKIASQTAHDFNNVFTTIVGFAELEKLLLNDIPEAQRSQLFEINQNIIQSTEKGTKLVRNLITMSSKETMEETQSHLSQMVEKSYLYLEKSVGSKSIIELDLCPIKLPIPLSEFEVEQIITNLVFNANDAVKKDGRIGIRTSITKGFDLKISDVEKQYACLEVEDNGSGIQTQPISRIFDTFYTTKNKGFGIGLGLVKRIMEKVNGVIDVETKSERGTIFRLYFPIVEAENQHIIESKFTKDFSCLENKNFILIDDNVQLGKLYKTYLNSVGANITIFNDPITLLSTFTSDNQIDLIISDISMPSMNGIELSNKLLGRGYNGKFMFISAYYYDDIEEPGSIDPHSFLAKPFTVEQFFLKICDILS